MVAPPRIAARTTSTTDRSPAASDVVARCDAHRAAKGRPTVSELDASPSFRGSLHVAGEHASLLTFACALADLQDLDRERFEIVGVCGNSMGWYGALAAAGALPIDHAIELVETMGAYQAGNVIGGQVIYPLRDTDGHPDPTLRHAIDAALQTARERGEGAWWSIDLGSHAWSAGPVPFRPSSRFTLPFTRRCSPRRPSAQRASSPT